MYKKTACSETTFLNIKKLLLFFILVVSYLTLFSQNFHEIQKQHKFIPITIDDGLSNNSINSICQDKEGYMWFASLIGLNKYNGIDNVVYTVGQKENSGLTSNIVNKVFCDSKGNIWAGTDKGLCLYDYYTDSFNQYFFGDSLGTSLNVRDIIEDSLNNVWFATSGGLYALNLMTNEKFNLFDKIDIPEHLENDTVDNLLLEGGASIWLSFFKSDVCIVNIQKGSCKVFKAGSDFGTNGNPLRIEDIYKDKHGYVWFGTYNNGVQVFNPYDSSFSSQTINVKNDYTTRVRTFFEDNKGDLFFGTRGGMYIFDRKSKGFKLYADVKHKFSKISNNSILSSYIDNSGGLWLGTRFGGVNYSNMERKPFVHFPAGEDDKRFLNHPSVFAFAESSNGNIYIGTEKGVNILDVKTYTFKYITAGQGESKSLSYNDVKALTFDMSGDLWVATNNGGLNKINNVTGTIKHYKNNPKDSNSLSSDKAYYLLSDVSGDLWAITNPDRENSYSTLNYLKKGSDKFIHYEGKFYGGIYEKADGNLLIGAVNGFYLFDRKSAKFLLKENDSLIGNVLCIYEDIKGNIWIGSNQGLTRYDIKNNQFSQYDHDTGYPIDEVYGILSSDGLNVWVSTNSGLVKINEAVEQNGQVKYEVYTKNDGLQSKQFNPNAYFLTKKGEMLFGGINGFNFFYPDKIKVNRHKPRIVFADVKVGNKIIRPKQKVHNETVLSDLIGTCRKITIPAKAQTFSVFFHAIHYANPGENKFKYILEGYDSEWTTASAYNNFVTYTDLPYGNYKLNVVAINSDGLNSDPAIVEIEKLPFFWNIIWFQLGMLVLVIVAAYLFYRIRVFRLRTQRVILANKVKQKTKELHSSYLKLQEHQNEVLAQNEEIKCQNEEIYQQNEEIIAQRDEIQRKSDEIEAAFNKARLLNDFGKKITASLNIREINRLLHKFMSSHIEVSVFGIGIFNEESKGLVFSSLTDNKEIIPEFSSLLDDTSSIGAFCYNNQEVVICNDLEKEYKNYISELNVRTKRVPKSVIYMPMTVNGKKIGVFTVQSYNYDAYKEQDINTFESLASFVAIAYDNSWAYDNLREQNDIIEIHRTNLSKLVYERTQDLEKALVKAEEGDKLKTAFLANMSHEIRTPLNAIVGFIEVISNENVTEEEKDTLFPLIQNSGFYLSGLINDIIDFSKIESDQLEINLQNLKVKPILVDLYNTFKEEVRRNNISRQQDVIINLMDDGLNELYFYCDEIRFKQILNNLLGNALKFTTKGEIRFGVDSKDEKYVTFFVKDTGIGIEEKYFDIIFERFRKIEDNTENLYRGTGLGLAITQYLLVRLGGDIWLESEYGAGTTFYFKLPVIGGDNNSQSTVLKQVELVKSLPNWAKKSVMIVEDEKSNYFLLESILKKTNVGIIWAKDGVEAIDMYRLNNESINLILMDVKLPNKSGIDAAREIKALSGSIPIIAQTAHALPQEEYSIRNSGFDEYISKPISKEKLIDLMSQFI